LESTNKKPNTGGKSILKGLLSEVEINPSKGLTLKGINRVVRGGSWNNNAQNCNVSYRNNNRQTNRNHNIGCRLLFMS
jgi:formylglycine-generating enzyme required for sulfatase activity